MSGAPSIEHLANKFLFPFNRIHEERMARGPRRAPPHRSPPRPPSCHSLRAPPHLLPTRTTHPQIRKRNLTAEEVNTVRATEQALRRLKQLPRRSSVGARSSRASDLGSDLGGPRQSVAFGGSIPRTSAASLAGSSAPRASSVAGSSVAGSPGPLPRQSSAAAPSPDAGAQQQQPRQSSLLHRRSMSGRQSVAFTADAARPASPGAPALTASFVAAEASAASQESPARADTAAGGGLPPQRKSLRAGEDSMFSAARRASQGQGAPRRASLAAGVTWAGDGEASALTAAREITPEVAGPSPFGDGAHEPPPARPRASNHASPATRNAEAIQRALKRHGSSSTIKTFGAAVDAAAFAAAEERRLSASGAGAGPDAAFLRQYSVFSQAAVRIAQRRSGASAAAARASALAAAEPGDVRSTVESVRRALFGGAPRMCAAPLSAPWRLSN